VPIRLATLIANPKTGRYSSRRLRPIEDVASQLRSLGVDVEIKLTTAPGEATEFAARAARNGTSDVIVAGGDGTINEAVQGLAGSNARLAIIPRGTGNVLARELKRRSSPRAVTLVAFISVSRSTKQRTQSASLC
jgi:diacylglycerol kinase family enzyme